MDSFSQQSLHPKINSSRLLFFMGLMTFLILLVRTAWQADDAYTAWRLVDNFVNGFGLRNNIVERVQTFTSTGWTMLNAFFFFFFRNIYYTSIGLSIVCSLSAVYVAGIHYVEKTSAVVYLFLSVMLSLCFMDFSVGGFENPLGHLILATFCYVFFIKKDDWKHRFFMLFFLAAIGGLTRLDVLAFYLPCLILTFKESKEPLSRKIKIVLLGILPLIIWHSFAIIYFGFPLQNAAYAKRFNGIPTREFIRAGVDYYMNSFSRDPLTLITAVSALLVSLKLRKTNKRIFALGFGIAFYMAYVLYVGGDYMSGRFFTMIFFASVLTIINSRVLEDVDFSRVAIGFVLILGCLAVNPTFTTRKNYGDSKDHGPTSEWLDKGIADERASWYPSSGLLYASRHIDMPRASEWWDPRQAVKDHMAAVGSGPCVTQMVPAGYFSFFTPRECHMYDLNGQVDPLMARIPNRYNRNWRQGHLFKEAIPGYHETLVSGKNQIQDPDIAEYYEKIKIITRDDIWSWERFKVIFMMNTGQYSYLLKGYAERNNISW